MELLLKLPSPNGLLVIQQYCNQFSAAPCEQQTKGKQRSIKRCSIVNILMMFQYWALRLSDDYCASHPQPPSYPFRNVLCALLQTLWGSDYHVPPVNSENWWYKTHIYFSQIVNWLKSPEHDHTIPRWYQNRTLPKLWKARMQRNF